MRKSTLFSCLGALVLAASTYLLPITASAGNWSVNIGLPVAVAPAPAVVYSAPVMPVAAVVQHAPVVYPYVSGFVVSRDHRDTHYDYREYRGHRGYHRGHR